MSIPRHIVAISHLQYPSVAWLGVGRTIGYHSAVFEPSDRLWTKPKRDSSDCTQWWSAWLEVSQLEIVIAAREWGTQV